MKSTEPAAVEFILDGRTLHATTGETILQAAQRAGVDIPHLCYKPGYRADGNCRACVVEIEGERVLAPSCCRQPSAGMRAHARSERAVHSQRMVLELLAADMPPTPYCNDSELSRWTERLAIGAPRFPARHQTPPDRSHPAMWVKLDVCIQCTRCVRACREEQGNDVIGYAGRGAGAHIVFDCGDALGESTCVACGECVQACPTGALMPAREVGLIEPQRQVQSVCPYCGVGCRLNYHVKDNRILYVSGSDGPANHERLCVKGRFGFDYVHHAQRLTRPLVRKAGVGKSKDFKVDPSNPWDTFREVTWEEALDLAATRFREIRDRNGPRALAGFGSAKGSNEEAYLFQKLIRTGFGCNNVDHCTRLCHASSVAALLEGIGSGAVSNPVADVLKADLIFVIGANPTVNHPVAATWIKNAVCKGAKLVVADPRRSDLARHATHFLQFTPDSDVALLNAMMHTIIDEDLVDAKFIAERTVGFDEIRRNVAAFSPEAMAPVCGIAADTIREVARLYAKSQGSMILWGMGISQHVHGTDNARCLIALALMTGQIGRPGCGLHPLRGQNNVQGASDAGLIPMVFPDYQRVDNEAARAKFEALWGYHADPEPGLTVVEIINASRAGSIKGMYIMGENPAMSDPDLDHARAGLANLEWLVVQDIFLTETAYLADVVLPASAFPEKTGTFTNTDRIVQLGRKAIEPPGDAREDLWIILQMAQRLGLEWHYPGAAEVFDEMRRAMRSIAGITWQRLEAEGGVTYPCEHEGDAGQPVVFTDRFATDDGRARFVPARLIAADEQPDPDFPMVLITGRQLEHWHTGAMTRRTQVLAAIEPGPVASLHTQALANLGVAPGEMITVASRRGRITLQARADDGTPLDAVFIPFCYHEAAANLLTNPALDPYGKISEFKFCAVRVERAPDESSPSDAGTA